MQVTPTGQNVRALGTQGAIQVSICVYSDEDHAVSAPS